jgi:hypothetical protein
MVSKDGDRPDVTGSAVLGVWSRLRGSVVKAFPTPVAAPEDHGAECSGFTSAPGPAVGYILRSRCWPGDLSVVRLSGPAGAVGYVTGLGGDRGRGKVSCEDRAVGWARSVCQTGSTDTQMRGRSQDGWPRLGCQS